MAARFTQGTNTQSTRSLAQVGKVREVARGRGTSGGVRRGNTMQGMPGYIKTTQDKSSSGLAGGPGLGAPGANVARSTGPRREGAIPSRRGENRKNWEASARTGGSTDVRYRETSTGPAGKIRELGEPKAPAKRGTSEGERPYRTAGGNPRAVAEGGTRGEARLPAQGATARSFGEHRERLPSGGHGTSRASGEKAAARGGFRVTGRESSIGNKPPPTAKGFIGGGRGTMESLRGRTNVSDNFGTGKPRGRSQMY